MGSRDAGWLQIYARDVQEAYETAILAVRIAEQARLPVMVCLDGFTLSHGLEPVDLFDDEEVRAFVGTPNPSYSILSGAPITVGPLALPDSYMEFRRAQAEAMALALHAVADATEAFNGHFGRNLPIFLETIGPDDAEAAIFLLGGTADLAAEAVARWADEGRKVQLVRLRLFRPFPVAAVRAALSRFRRVAVLERADTLSTLGGPLVVDSAAALYGSARAPRIFNRIFGLGGRELRSEDLDAVAALLLGEADGPPVGYLGVRGDER